MQSVSIFLILFACAMLFSFFYLSRKFIFLFEDKHKKKVFVAMFIIEIIIAAGFFGVRLFRSQQNLPSFMRFIAWISYTTLGLFSFIIVLFILIDIIFYIKKIVTKNEVDFRKRKFLISGAFLFAAFSSGRAFYNAVTLPKVKKVLISLQDLAKELENLKIVQITDLHIGVTIGKEFVEGIVAKINEVNADIVAITGDVADGFVHQINDMLMPLSQLKSKYGIYYVTGNHEYYWRAHEWTQFMKRLGIIVLENEHKIIQVSGHKIAIAGVTDYTAGNYDTNKISNPKQAILNCEEDVALKILLAHQPRSAFIAEQAGYHLQLSGHTHGGQFWPWTWIVPLVQPFVAGLTQYKNMWLYVSRGTGYWGPPARLGAESEITFIVLNKSMV